MLPDVAGIDRAFDYVLPPALDGLVEVGTIVRVPLQGRRVRGWVLERGVEPPAGVEMREVVAAVSVGPAGDVVELTGWASWRYAGKRRWFLLAASPHRIVPPQAPRAGSPAAGRALPAGSTMSAGGGGGDSSGAPAGGGRGDRGVEAAGGGGDRGVEAAGGGGDRGVEAAGVGGGDRGVEAAGAGGGDRGVEAAGVGGGDRGAVAGGGVRKAVTDALSYGRAVLRLPPAASRLEAVESALAELGGAGGSVLVLVPERPAAETLARLLRRRQHEVALQPDDWALAAGASAQQQDRSPAVGASAQRYEWSPAAGASAHRHDWSPAAGRRSGGLGGGRPGGERGPSPCDPTVVVGVRGAAFAPAPGLRGVVVVDAHAESYVESHAPTWNAFVVAAERARRCGVPCLATSPCPAPEHLAWGELVTLDRREERGGWPVVEVIDRRSEDPRSGLYSPRLAGMIRRAVEDGLTAASRSPVLCVLNRTGRAKLLACTSCGELVRCDRCGAAEALRSPAGAGEGDTGKGDRGEGDIGKGARRGERSEGATLACPGCGTSRLPRCLLCGSTRLNNLRPGVGRVREELAALTGLEVAELTAGSGSSAGRAGGTGAAEPRRDSSVSGEKSASPVVVGTEAVLHRVRASPLVVFLDFDQELLASRMRAGEHAFALLALAGRIVGGRNDGRGRIVVQTRMPESEVLAAAVHGDPDRASEPDVERRRLLGLPPFRAVAVVSGPGAPALVEALRARAGGAVEVGGEQGDRFLVRAPSETVLADALALAREALDGLPAPTQPARIEVDPVAL